MGISGISRPGAAGFAALRSGVPRCVLAVPRGVVLAGLAVTGLVLVTVPASAVFLTVAGILNLMHGGGSSGLRDLVAVALGVAVIRFITSQVLLTVRRLAAVTRRLLGRWCGVVIPGVYQPAPPGLYPGHGAGHVSYQQRMAWLLTDPATWRDLLWCVAGACVGTLPLLLPTALVAGGLIEIAGTGRQPAGFYLLALAVVVAGVWSAPLALRAYGGLASAVLSPSEQAVLKHRVTYLDRTRKEALDNGAAELRRIERDLHDGAQARLVAMGLTLDAAARLIDTDAGAARALVLEARDASGKALAELRDLVRGIHPPVLADRGLDDAIRALALDSPLPVRVTGGLPARRLPAPVESAAYFAVSELLANVAKHARADGAEIDLRFEQGMLRIAVRDDGQGGAAPAGGTGLNGIARRLGAFDGVLAVNSPAGGPTMITMEIPCALS